RGFAADELADFLRIEGFAPRLGKADHFAAVAASHFADAVAEEAVGEEGKFLAGFDEVCDCGFHAGAARAGDGNIELVAGGIGVAQEGANFFHYLEEERVEMAHYR